MTATRRTVTGGWCAGLAAVLAVAGCSSGGPATTTPPLASAAASASVSPTAAPAPTAADWTTYHHDAAHTGQVGGTVTGLTLRKNYALDGAVYASPLVVPTTAGSTVVVATEGGTVYGFRGDAVAWKTHVADPVTQSDLPCGNIDPLGITGTPVYDPGSGLVYAVAETGGPIRHELVAIDPSSGRTVWQVSADTPGMQPRNEQQRGALNISDGKVWVPYGGLSGDCAQYVGRVVGFALGRTAPAGLIEYTVPTSREGGIWNSDGVVVDGDGSLLATAGNGASTSAPYDGSDSVIRLGTDGRRSDFFAPSTWIDDNVKDLDLGSMGPLLMPDGAVVQAGKRAVVFLLDGRHLGGIGGQVASTTGCRGFGGGAVAGSGASALAVLPCTQGVTAYSTAGGKLARVWRSSDTAIIGSPVVVGSTVLAVDPSGALAALDAATGKKTASLRTGALSRFASPAVSGSTLYLGTMKGLAVVDLG